MAISKSNVIKWDLDNSGSVSLSVPGFGGVPVDYELAVDERFAHGIWEWRQSPAVTAQEFAMVAVINQLTDTPNWFVDVFDNATVARWREDLERDRFILNPRLMKDKTWAWCVQELRDKAVYYEKHGHIRVLDTGSCICKAESAELQSLSAVFRQEVGSLACQYEMRRKRQEQRKLLKASSQIQMAQLEPEEYEDGGPVEQDPFYDYPLRRDEEPSGDGYHTANDVVLTREGDQDAHQVDMDASSHNAPIFPVVENDVAADLSASESMSEDVIPYSTDTDGGSSEDEDENFNNITNVNWEGNKSRAGLEHQRKTLDIEGSKHMFASLVDPLLYPLVYGRTLVLQQGGIVALGNPLSSYGAVAQPAPRHNCDWGANMCRGPGLWSRRYQSLPFEMAFVGDDGSSNSRNITNVKITSYINGLHPDNHGMYRAIEQVLSHSVQLWNDCLIHGHRGLYDRAHLGQLGPIPARIVTYGMEWENELPEWAVSFRVPTEHRKRLYHEEKQEKLQLLPEGSRRRKKEEGYLRTRFTDVHGKEDRKLPLPNSDLWQRAREYLGQSEPEAAHFDPEASPRSKGLSAIPDDWGVGDERTWDLLIRKAKRILSFKHPEAGTAFSYEEWKHNRHTSRPIVDKAVPKPSSSSSRPVIIPVTPPHMHDPIALQDQFRDQGLQVIAEISSIELTPETPAYVPDAAARIVVSTTRATEQFARAMASDSM